MAMSKKDKTAYKNNFNKENYVRIGLYVDPELKDQIKAHADQMGESLNGFIKRAINETMERDNKKESG